jgi:PHP family Zn ribbon phosphoesterase
MYSGKIAVPPGGGGIRKKIIWHHEAENTKTRPKKLLKNDSSSYLR